MPTFTIRKQVDAYVSYYSEVDADNAQEAVDHASESYDDIKWDYGGVSEFDAVRVTAIDNEYCEIDDYSRGDA